ncbi:MAG: hypothetical protein WDN31_11600 [Hyphomicrobium sp.]
MLGVCLTLGGLRHRHQDLKRQGTNALLAVVVALSVLTLVLPNFTLTSHTGEFTALQLGFVSLLCVLLYGAFVLAQTTRHRDDFVDELQPETAHHEAPKYGLVPSVALLLIGLIGIVLLAEHVASSLEHGLGALDIGQTDAIVGAFIATLVLMPEGGGGDTRGAPQRTAARPQHRAGIGLRDDRVDYPHCRGRQPDHGHAAGSGTGRRRHGAAAFGARGGAMISFATGRTTALTGAVHIVVFVAYLLLIIVP